MGTSNEHTQLSGSISYSGIKAAATFLCVISNDFSHIELLSVCFNPFRNKVGFTNIYLSSKISMNLQQCSIPIMNHQDLSIFEPPMNKRSLTQSRTTLQPRYANNQLRVSSILHFQITYNTFILLSLQQEATFPRQLTWFYWGAMEPIPGDTPEPSGNIVSNYSFILTSSSRELHQAEHFIKHNIPRSMTSIYWQPSLKCKLHLNFPSQ